MKREKNNDIDIETTVKGIYEEVSGFTKELSKLSDDLQEGAESITALTTRLKELEQEAGEIEEYICCFNWLVCGSEEQTEEKSL
jgi:peptidoglycan hydrolase CwlO-like protein